MRRVESFVRFPANYTSSKREKPREVLFDWLIANFDSWLWRLNTVDSLSLSIFHNQLNLISLTFHKLSRW